MAESCQKTLRITIQNISCFFYGMTFQPITGVTFVLPMDKNMLWKNKNPTTMQRHLLELLILINVTKKSIAL